MASGGVGGVRELTVLEKFKPFGLTAEAMDGGKHSDDDEDYRYFLFDPRIAEEQRDDEEEPDQFENASSSSYNRSDHELFIRGNRIIWSTGSRVCKRFTLPSKVIQVCWCRMGDVSEALLCVLQMDSLTIYGVAGEVVSVPLSHAISSIWPLPYGLLLQRAAEGSLLTNISLSSSNALLGGRDVFHSKRDVGYSPQHNYNPPHPFETKSDGTSTSSHLILKDPLEDPQIIYVEERGKLNLLWEFDEKTIWTNDIVPLLASYNKGKMQHSLWVVEVIKSNLEVRNSKSADVLSSGMLAKHFFRRIWQGKGSQTAASKVFLATDNGTTPIVCFLLQEQKKLLCLGLQSLEINGEIVYDVKPDVSWTITAIDAAAVAVTRGKVRKLPLRDVIALTSENTLLLYGSISVSMSIHQTLFCFVCTHLTSGEKDGDAVKRNADVHEIHRRTRFNPFSAVGLPRSIYDHERIIWLGDLNYRINLSYERTREIISQKDWPKLLERDQLVKELKKGRAFDGWSEGTLNFAPTYKYELNSEAYCGEDPKSGRRTPAWCDRILSFGAGMKLLSYRRSELKFSDHRPVTATYMVEVEVFSPRKLQRALTFTDAEIEEQDIVTDMELGTGLNRLRLEQNVSYWER